MLSELDNYRQRIENLREQVINLLDGLPANALNWRPVEGGDDHAANSLAVLAAHMAGAEHFWIAEVVGNFPATRNRPAEFATQATNPADLQQLLQQTGAQTQAILSALPEQELNQSRLVQGRTVPVRWAILHVIDHTALHLGHMQITYQLWMQGQAKPTPPWQERLPRDA